MVTPYIIFNKQCEEALNFYERVFNGKNKEILRYNDYIPETEQELPSDLENYILHAKMEIFNTEFTFADEFSKPVVAGNMVHLTITPSSKEEGNKIFNELKENGEVYLAPVETFYSPLHATVKDKFGIVWNIIVITI
jgi:PhnB protein